MISSFFDQTKPINFVVLLGFVLCLFWGVTLRFEEIDFTVEVLTPKILASVALMLSVFLLGNLVKIKKLTLDNSFAMLFFCVLILTFFMGIINHNGIFCYFFLLLSWDRTLALKSEKNHKEKVFEACFWTFIASLFIDWAVIFLIPVYIAISLFSVKELKLWLMPIAAFACVSILAVATALLIGNLDFFKDHYQFATSLEFFRQSSYGSGLYVIFSFAIAVAVFGKLGYRRLGRTLLLRLIFAYLVVSVLLLLFSKNENKGFEILTFFPVCIFLTNYLETIKKQQFREIIVLACIVLPLAGLVIRLVQ